MKEYRLKITGVHYAANPNSVAGQPRHGGNARAYP